MTVYDDEQIESLLFTDSNGDRCSFDDVMADGLDGDYADRLVLLNEIAQTAAPVQQRVLAVALLVAWGEEVGLATAIDWLDEHDSSDDSSGSRVEPWFSDFLPVVVNAIDTSFWKDQTSRFQASRESTLRRIVGLADQYWLGSDIGATIARALRDSPSLESDLKAIVGRCLTILVRDEHLEFDLSMQTAALILPLSKIDDSSAARFARALLNTSSRELVARELVESLRQGAGPATREVLRQLANNRSERVTKAAAAALSRRTD